MSSEELSIKTMQDKIKTKLHGKRILVCGKGGSGKSTIVTLFANALDHLGCNLILLDGDASNPGGLSRMLFGTEPGPRPLIDFFGGREKVECPVDNPSPLTRLNDKVPITEKLMELDEIPSEFYHKSKHTVLFQVGKINKPNEGCDGPMSKVVRDFIVDNGSTTLIDVEAGIEHYGRGIEKNVDIVLIVVDPTYESILIAEKVKQMCELMEIENVWAIINKVRSFETKNVLQKELENKNVDILGIVHCEQAIEKAGLTGKPFKSWFGLQDIMNIINNLVLKI